MPAWFCAYGIVQFNAAKADIFIDFRIGLLQLIPNPNATGRFLC